MAKDFASMEDSNRSSNPSIYDVSDPARRVVLRGGIGLSLGTLLAQVAGCASGGAAAANPSMGFKGIPALRVDKVTVPDGYVAQVLAAWGEPIGIAGAAMPAFRFDAGNSAEEQALQMG